MTIKRKRGDTRPFRAILTTAGRPIPAPGLTGSTVKFLARPAPGSDGVVVVAQADIEDEAKCKVVYVPSQGEFVPGVYRHEYEVTFADGSVETFPSDSWIDLIILEDLNPPVSVARAVTIPWESRIP